MKLYLASNNSHKRDEVVSLLPGYELVTPAEENITFVPEETGTSFFENAFIKALSLYEMVQKPVIADDSGLCIDWLNGAPGLFSARYGEKNGIPTSSEEKIALILEQMKGVKNRRAHFTCCIVVLFSRDRFFSVQETCEGEIAERQIGKKGFGYDPIFYLKEAGKTFAELTEAEKNELSHRGKALRAIVHLLNGK